MANKQMQEIRDMADTDLQAKLEESNVEYRQLKFDHATKGLDDPMKIRNLRREIARMHTEIRNRALSANSGDAAEKRDKIRKRRRRK
jgi:large subunit ribosomal protein L29